jgi:hypothetical protein
MFSTLLTIDDSRALLQEAWRLLPEGGMIGLVSLSHGFTRGSRAMERVWIAIRAIRLMLVGGCRPTSLPALNPSFLQTIPFNSLIYNLHGIDIRK